MNKRQRSTTLPGVLPSQNPRSPWAKLRAYVRRRLQAPAPMGCNQSVGASPFLAEPQNSVDPHTSTAGDSSEKLNEIPLNSDPPVRQTQSLRLESPSSHTRKATTLSPASGISNKVLTTFDLVQQMYAAARARDVGYLDVVETRDDNPSKTQPLTQALAVCNSTLKAAENQASLLDLVQLGLPNAIVALMQKFSTSGPVQIACMRLIAKILDSSMHSKDRLRAAGICQALVATLPKMSGSREAQYMAMNTMAQLMADNMQNVIAFGAAGAPGVIVATMRANSADLQLQYVACLCIYYLCLNGSTNMALGQVGACECIVAVVKKSADIPVVLHEAVLGLCAQSSNAEDFGEVGLCEILISFLSECATMITAQGLVLSMIRALATTATNRRRLLQANVCEAITGLQQLHPLIVFIQEQICETIYILAQDEDISQQLGMLGACEAILQSMRTLSSHPQIHFLSCLALYSLSHFPGNYQRLGQLGALQQIQRALDQFEESSMNSGTSISPQTQPKKKQSNTRKLGSLGSISSEGGHISRLNRPNMRAMLSKMSSLRQTRAMSNDSNPETETGSHSDSVHSRDNIAHQTLAEEPEQHEGSDSDDD